MSRTTAICARSDPTTRCLRGCQSYMGDSVSMIFFTVSDEYTQNLHTAPRITREIFCYTDRYKLADGSIREKVQAKYNCYQRGQHLRECDGQALYLAERVDRIVVAYADELFRKIKSEPYDKSIEQRIRQQDAEHNRQKQAAEKKIRAAQYKQKRYEDEVLKCLEGESAFSQEVLARLIAQAEAEVRQAKDEYASMLQNNDDRTTNNWPAT